MKYWKIWTAVGVLLVIAIGFFLYRARPDLNTAHMRRTPGWTKYPEKYEDPETAPEKRRGIFLKSDSSNTLFVKHSLENGVYKYSSETKLISEATEDDWNNSTGEITVCGRQVGASYNSRITLKTSHPEFQVRINGAPLPTEGTYAVQALESPSHSRVAVLSGAGPVWGFNGGLIFGGAGPQVRGLLFAQIYDFYAKRFTGEAIKIEDPDEKSYYNLCWSSDEKYLVVHRRYENLSVIETTGTP